MNFTHVLRLIMTCFIFCILIPIYGQLNQASSDNFNCKTDQLIEELMANDDQFRKQSDAFELGYRAEVENRKTHPELTRKSTIYTIPPVVHLLHSAKPLGSIYNPEDETIQSNIQEASDRFRHQHSQAETFANPYMLLIQRSNYA